MKADKWLLRKASGSRAKLKWGGDYADDKPSDSILTDELPLREPVKKATITYLDTSLIKRWLNNYVGKILMWFTRPIFHESNLNTWPPIGMKSTNM